MKKDFKKDSNPGGFGHPTAFRAVINAALNIELACGKHSIYKK